MTERSSPSDRELQRLIDQMKLDCRRALISSEPRRNVIFIFLWQDYLAMILLLLELLTVLR